MTTLSVGAVVTRLEMRAHAALSRSGVSGLISLLAGMDRRIAPLCLPFGWPFTLFSRRATQCWSGGLIWLKKVLNFAESKSASSNLVKNVLNAL
jgi:hypothetical protein